MTLRLTRLDWRREMMVFLVAAMEVAWFTPWYLALIPATARLPPGRTAVGLFLVVFISAYTARLLARLRLRPQIEMAALAALLVLTCLLALRLFLYAGQAYRGLDWLGETLVNVLDVSQFIPDWFVVVLSTLFLWWRGLRLGQQRSSVQAVTFSFYTGVVSYVGFVLIVHLVTNEDPSPFIPIFFFFSLMALATARMDEMRWRRGAAVSSFGFFWLTAMALAALAIVFLGVALGALVAGRDFQSALGWIQPLLLLVGVILGVFVVALRIVMSWLLGFLRSPEVSDVAAPLAELVDELGELIPQGSELTLQAPPGLGALRLLLILGLVVGLGLLLVLLARHYRWAMGEWKEADQESAFSAALLVENLRQRMRGGRDRLAAALGLVERAGWRGLFAALTVRRIYAQMQRLAAQQGYPRAAFQTPFEYESVVVRVFPEATAEVRAITQAYVAVHYGEVPETNAELQEIHACWDRLKGTLQD